MAQYSRYRFQSTEKLKRAHRVMINNFDVKRVRVQRDLMIVFSTCEIDKVKEFILDRGVDEVLTVKTRT